MKRHSKKILRILIKYPITVWMVLSILILSSILAIYAAYNGTGDVKRVVSTQTSSNSAFSSNYMEVFSSTNIAVKNLRTTTEGNFICPITVCNYDQLDPTAPAHNNIEYSFTAELVKYNSATDTYDPVTTVQTKDGGEAKTFYVQKVINDNLVIISDPQHSLNSTQQGVGVFSYTYSSENLAGDNSYRDTYNICFDATEVALDVPELFIRVSATPTQDSVQMNSGVTNLASIISISQGRTVETGWNGTLQEASSTDYDGYNLIIEGSGAGTIDILWNDTKFAMNPAFITKYGPSGSGILTDESSATGREGWKKRTLTVDSATGDNRYVVQFYKRIAGTYTGSEFPSKYIKCENYVQDVGAGTP